MVSKGFPNGVHRINSIISGRSPPSHCMYTNINHHVETPKQKQTHYYNTYSIYGLRVPDYGTVMILYREVKLKMVFGVVISSYFEGSLQVIDVKDLNFTIYSMPTDTYIYESRCLKV